MRRLATVAYLNALDQEEEKRERLIEKCNGGGRWHQQSEKTLRGSSRTQGSQFIK